MKTTTRDLPLWITAGLMALALVLLLLPEGWFSPSPAQGAVVSQSGTFTIMTADGTNEDLLIVMDGRSEQMLVFRTERLQELQLLQKLSLPQVFADARAKSGRR